MKVTGWTYYENPKYINIVMHNIELRSNALKSVPDLPSKRELELYNGDLQELLAERYKLMDKALDTMEIKESNALEREIYSVVKEDIIEHRYCFSGSSHQGLDFSVPIIDDKYILCLSQRDWGELIAECYPDQDWSYLDWAWSWRGNNDKEKFIKYPDKSLWVDCMEDSNEQ